MFQKLTFKLDGKEIELTEKQARELYNDLDRLFGRKPENPFKDWNTPQWPYQPLQPPSPTYDQQPYVSPGWLTPNIICGTATDAVHNRLRTHTLGVATTAKL